MKTTLHTEPRQVRLPKVLWRRLAVVATRLSKSRAEVIREQLANFVKREEIKNKIDWKVELPDE